MLIVALKDIVGIDYTPSREVMPMRKFQRKQIKTTKAPRILGPVSQGIRGGNLIFVAAGPTDPKGKILKDDFEQAVKQTLKNVKAILEAGGSLMEKIMRVDVYLQNMEDIEKFNKIYTKYVPQPYPVRSVSQPARTPKDHPLGMVVTALAD